MSLSISVRADSEEDSVLSLFDRLSSEADLGGVLQLRHGPLEPGTLGSAVDVLAVSLSSGAVATALARGLVAWLRTRTSDVTVRLDGVGEITTKNMRAMGPEAVEAYVRALAATVQPEADH